MMLDHRLQSQRFPRASQYHPEWVLASAIEIKAVEDDGGRYLGYGRVIGHRRAEAKLEEYCWPDTLRSFPQQYTRKPLLRSQNS